MSYSVADRYLALLESIDVGYCVIEMIFDEDDRPIDYRFIEINGAFERQSGLADVIGRRMRELAPGHGQYWFDFYGNVAVTGEPAQITNRAAAIGGRWYEVNAYRLAEGNRFLVGALFSNVTGRVTQEQVQRDYVAMVSHDLGTPMTVARAQAQLMKRRQLYDGDRIDTIIEQIDRMERLLSGLRNVVRAENGWLELRTEPIDLARLVAGAVDRGTIQSPSHRIVMQLDGPAVGDWDPERIDQILDNLIGNAIKYSDPGSTIWVGLSTDGATARIQVTDEGIGIAPDMLPKLFDRFYRASHGGAVQGMGLDSTSSGRWSRPKVDRSRSSRGSARDRPSSSNCRFAARAMHPSGLQ